MEAKFDEFDSKCVNTIRVLAAETVQGANSGHPGMPMGMAPIAHVLFQKHIRSNAKNPKWINRDRFVLSNGHGCALLYTMLHLQGYDVSMDDLKNFRQLNSKTPGHPEAADTPGVEVTTGPLGQGIANAVGLAMAESNLAATYNKPDLNVFDNYTYVFCGDGCLQEGVASEAASLAGHLGLGKIVVLWDDNHISIDGDTAVSFTEDVLKRFESYGWHTSSVDNGDSDLGAIDAAITAAKGVTDKPSIIAVRTTIGFGSGKEGTASVHGSPLGADVLKAVKEKFGFDPEQTYTVSDDVYAAYRANQGKHEEEWNALFAKYKAAHATEAAEIERRFSGKLPANVFADLPSFKAGDKAAATRSLSGTVLNAIAKNLPELIGGSADLTGSNKTALKGIADFQKDCRTGRYIRFGVREHGMAAICNGIIAYGGFVSFSATFLNFIEYCFPAVRLSALSHFGQLYIMTHDSIGLGEDGPTHQPIEALALCRATPNLHTYRPADGNETVGAYVQALKNSKTPAVLALTRQNLPHLAGSSADAVAKGAYVVFRANADGSEGKVDDAAKPDVTLVATGSEVSLAIEAAKMLKQNVAVVSVPCAELFDAQSAEYRRSVIVPGVPTVSIETAAVTGWERYAHRSIGMRTFGKSAPIRDVMKHFGFTPDQVAANVKEFVASSTSVAKELGVAPFGALPVHF